MKAFPRWSLVLVVVVLTLAALGALFYQSEEAHSRRQVNATLEAVAALKVDQIVQWRSDDLAHATVLMDSPFFVNGVSRWMADPRAAMDGVLRAQFETLRSHYGYHDILLVDPQGRVLFSLSGIEGRLHEEAMAALAEALHERRAVIGHLHAGPGESPAHVDTVAPVLDAAGAGSPPIGAVVLQTQAQRVLYPLIQTWPTASASAESLLVRRDGDDVLFLNELRHRSGTALRLRVPVASADLPAAMAVRGATGIVRGRDYRGVDVVAAIKPVPDSPWLLVAKVDSGEALAEWRTRSILIVALVLGLIGASAALAGVAWQRGAKRHYRAMFVSEAARRRSELAYRTVLMSIGDGVIATDEHGHVELLNPVAEALTGWRQEDARGRPIEETFHIVNEETRSLVENPVARVLAEGKVVGLANHTMLIARDGVERPIADSGAPIRDEQSRLLGVVLVFRDQTLERLAQQAVRAERDSLRSIMAASPVGILVVNADERVIEANAAAERMSGQSFADPASQRCGDVLGCVNSDSQGDGCGRSAECGACVLRRSVVAVLADGADIRDRDAEVLFRSADGPRRRWLTVSVAPVVLEGRRHALLAFTDVTDRKHAERALRESEERFRGLFENALNGVALHEIVLDKGGRPADYVFLAANPAFETHTGRRVVDILGKRATEAYPGIESTPLIEMYGRVVLTGEPAHVELFIEPAQRHYSISAFRVGPGRFAAVFSDITERKRAEQALRESEQRFRLLHEQSPVGYQSLDADGRILDVNDAWLQTLGYAREEVIGRWFGDLLAVADRAIFRGRFEQFKAHGHVQTEFTMLRSDGQALRAFFVGRAARDGQGRFERSHCVFTDVSERRRIEEQLRRAQKMEAVGQLAGGVAHDFRNQLTVIKGYGEMLLRQSLVAEDGREHVEEILKAADRSAATASRLLAFARRQALQPEVMDLSHEVTELTKTLPSMIGEDIELSILPGATACFAHVDPEQLHQALLNLVVNARDAMPDGGRLTLRTSCVDLDSSAVQSHPGARAGRYAVVTVEDTGSGMSPEAMSRLFEPFFSTKGVGKGTGLGLPMVHGFVTQSGGFVEVDSSPGDGCTFRLYFPSAEPGAAAAPRAPADDAPAGGTETVLVVEDERAVRSLVVEQLQSLGHVVLEADSPPAALTLLEGHAGPIDLLVTDLVMPGGNGAELAARVRELRPGIAVLFISGYGGDDLDRRGLKDAHAQVLAKPFTSGQLARSVRAALDRG